MSLRLVIESGPTPQAVTERVFDGGRLVIGRGDDADWRIEDPDMFISRRHAILAEDGGQVTVTDASSGGLYVDNAANPLGPGNTVPIEPGMRLRLGDFVLRVEAAQGEKPAEAPKAKGGMHFDFEFGAPPPQPDPEPRPPSLPDPFGLRPDAPRHRTEDRPAKTPKPLDQDDPFALDLRTADRPRETERPASGGYFSTPSPARPEPARETAPEAKPDIFGDIFGETFDRTSARSAEEVSPSPTEPAPAQDKPAPAVAPAPVDEDLRAALLRGMGLDAATGASGDPQAEMERLGRTFRALIDGVMHLLRTRAREKQKVRVAQTIIASDNVNPLKFLATADDVLAEIISPRGRGYLDPDAAVNEAFRDLTDHQLRTWAALQSALRRMVDRFDPDAIAAEMEDVGLLEQLAAGGRSAKLWQLYQQRYREIAAAAEEQFLGEVGADFRDAYEDGGRER